MNAFHVSGCIPITPLYLNAKILSTEKPIQIDPPEGMNDFVLFQNGTCVPGHPTHYDYVVGTTVSEFRVALTWEDPESPVPSPSSHRTGISGTIHGSV